MSLAECVICANQLNEAVKGKTIAKIIANQNPHTFVWFALEPAYAFCSHDKSNEFAAEYEKYLAGEKIKGADALLVGYSAYTFMYVGERALMFHVLRHCIAKKARNAQNAINSCSNSTTERRCRSASRLADRCSCLKLTQKVRQ